MNSRDQLTAEVNFIVVVECTASLRESDFEVGFHGRDCRERDRQGGPRQFHNSRGFFRTAWKGSQTLTAVVKKQGAESTNSEKGTLRGI